MSGSKNQARCVLVVTLASLSLGQPTRGIEPSSAEHDTARHWVESRLGTDPAAFPFSFRIGGKASREILSWCKIELTSPKVVRPLATRTIRITDPVSGLEICCEASQFADVPAVEWVLHFRNNGRVDTPILREILPLDGEFGASADQRAVVLHHAEGSHAELTDFGPRETSLGPNGSARLTAFGGRSSDGSLPFFNLAMPGGGGVAIGVGWTGQWAATFKTDGAGPVRVQAGMERIGTILHPWEEIRTPSILLVFWDGTDRMRGQNLLRRTLLAHAMPTVDGKPVEPPCAASPHAIIPFEATTEANMRSLIGNIAARRVPFDTWWIDAGWFTCGKNWARFVGNFEPDPQRFPHGLRPVAVEAHRAGLRFLLWFEPERAMPGTWLDVHNPDWLLRPNAEMPPELRYQINDGFRLLDLGNPQALTWLEGWLSAAVREVGIDILRIDFNMYPHSYWIHGEPADRVGMREVRYVTGLYHLFDTLRKEHPRLILDNCASSGRRVDIEMFRRALVLTRSDYLWDPTGQQCHTYGLAQWIPITGIGAASLDPYSVRSGLGSHFTLAADYGSTDRAVWDAIERTVTEFRDCRRDFSAMTPYSTAANAWMGWQFHRDDLGEGLVQAFRRPECPEPAITLRPKRLDPAATYEVTDRDSRESRRLRGDALMEHGWTFRLPEKRSAGIVTYRRVAENSRVSLRFKTKPVNPQAMIFFTTCP